MSLPQKLIQATAECKQHEHVEKEELHDVRHHPRQRHLQRSQVRIHREDVDKLQRTENVGSTEKTLGDQHRIPSVPLLSWQFICSRVEHHFFLHLRNEHIRHAFVIVLQSKINSLGSRKQLEGLRWQRTMNLL